jgi:hypothetical protein
MRLPSAVAFGLLICVVAAGPALADDLLPPDWRGAPSSTLQIWEFPTDDNPVEPDVSANPFGTALATIYGEFEFPNRDTFWIAEDYGHVGVWNIGGSIGLEIPNDPEPRAQKLIRLQLTYDGGPPPEPAPRIDVVAAAGGVVTDFQLVEQIILDDVYVHDTYDIVLEPNPNSETIWVLPRYCQIYIDQIVVDTLCVPEPSTLVSLIAGAMGVAACAVWRRRRGR